MRDDAPGVLDQDREQPVLDRREACLGLADPHLSPRQVHAQLPDREGRVAGLAISLSRVTEGHAHARQKLADRERLRHVVVRAGIERNDLVRLGTAGG